MILVPWIVVICDCYHFMASWFAPHPHDPRMCLGKLPAAQSLAFASTSIPDPLTTGNCVLFGYTSALTENPAPKTRWIHTKGVHFCAILHRKHLSWFLIAQGRCFPLPPGPTKTMTTMELNSSASYPLRRPKPPTHQCCSGAIWPSVLGWLLTATMGFRTTWNVSLRFMTLGCRSCAAEHCRLQGGMVVQTTSAAPGPSSTWPQP